MYKRLRLSWQVAKSDSLVGNFAIGCNMDSPSVKRGHKLARFWFSEWSLGGDKVEARPKLAFGPVLCALPTLSRGTLHLPAQMPPLGEQGARTRRILPLIHIHSRRTPPLPVAT